MSRPGWACVAALLFAIFSPYLCNFDGGRTVFNNSSVGDAIRTSQFLKYMCITTIGSSLHLIFLVFLNWVWPLPSATDITPSASLVVIFMMPATMHLIVAHHQWGPHLTLCCASACTVFWTCLGINDMLRLALKPTIVFVSIPPIPPKPPIAPIAPIAQPTA